MQINTEETKKWLDAHPVVRLLLARLTLALLGVLVGVLATLGLLPEEVAVHLRAVLGL